MAESAAHEERDRGEGGFTLLELVIALSLLTIMVAMTGGVFATALSAVPRGEAVAERSARLRAATGVIAKQVRSTVNYPAHNDEDEVFPYFWGDPHSFSFITSAPQHRGGEGLGWVTYWTDGRTLWMGERLIFSAEAVSGTAPDPSFRTPLLEGLSAARFQYLRLEGDDGEWRDTWDGLDEQNLPGAVRISLEGVNDGRTYWVEEIPVMVVAYGLGAYDAEIGIQNGLDAADDDDGSSGGGGSTGGGGGSDDGDDE